MPRLTSVIDSLIDQSVDAAIPHHFPGVFGCRDIRFAVESDVRKCVTIDESVKHFSGRCGRREDTPTGRPIEQDQ